jgi:hypothetical protein
LLVTVSGAGGRRCGFLTFPKRDRDERPEALGGIPLRPLIDPAQAASLPKVVFVPLVGAISADA